MEIIHQFISEDIIYALGWTVMHSLWQAFAIAIILAAVLHLFRRHSAKSRYEASAFALFLVLVSAVSTFIWYFDAAGQNLAFISQSIITGEVTISAAEPDVLSSFTQTCIDYFNTHLPLIVTIWLVGVAFFVLRLMGGLAYVQRLKHYRTSPLPKEWEDRLLQVTRKVPVKKSIKIMESAAVKVPMVIGYLKPFILLPVGAINQLAAEEVEAIIAHEVAHIYRNDFLMNIFISFIEVFFYYNPAVWWISGNIRLERENCCDDIAIKVCGNSLSYAKALVRLQELNAYTPSFAMPFSGRRNQLLHRIQRILNQPQNRNNILERLMATLFLLFAVVFMSVNQNTILSNAESPLLIIEEVSELEEPLEAEMVSVNKKYKIVEVQVDDEGTEQQLEMEQEFETEDEIQMVVEIRVDDRLLDKEVELAQVLDTDRIIVRGTSKVNLNTTQMGYDNLLNVVNDTTPERGTKNSNHFFYSNSPKRGQHITRMKNEDGQTVIMIDVDGGEDIEIVVGEDTEQVFVNGSSLKSGDTTIILEEGSGRSNVYWLDKELKIQRELDRLALDRSMKKHWSEGDKMSNYYFFDTDSIKGDRYAIIQKLRGEEEALRRKLKEDYKVHQDQEKLRELHGKVQLERQMLEEQKALAELKMQERDHIRHLELQQVDAYAEIFKNDPYTKMPSRVASQLKADGLIEDEQNFQYSLSHKRLKINGRKQSTALHQKYLKIHEEITGAPLDKKSTCEISLSKN